MTQADTRSISYLPTARTTPTRHRERASFDRAAVHAVLDEALVSHLGFVVEGSPVVLPVLHCRLGETLYLHGSTGSRWASLVRDGGVEVCVTTTLIDGLVFARSWMHHSAQYRSVVVRGRARLVQDEQEKIEALGALMDHVSDGRSTQSRPPNSREAAKTAVLAVDLVEVSLKARDGEVSEEPEDLESPYWAGLVPLRVVGGAPRPVDDLAEGISTPGGLIDYCRG